MGKARLVAMEHENAFFESSCHIPLRQHDKQILFSDAKVYMWQQKVYK